MSKEMKEMIELKELKELRGPPYFKEMKKLKKLKEIKVSGVPHCSKKWTTTSLAWMKWMKWYAQWNERNMIWPNIQRNERNPFLSLPGFVHIHSLGWPRLIWNSLVATTEWSPPDCTVHFQETYNMHIQYMFGVVRWSPPDWTMMYLEFPKFPVLTETVF